MLTILTSIMTLLSIDIFSDHHCAQATPTSLSPDLEKLFENGVDAFEDRKYEEAKKHLSIFTKNVHAIEEKAQAHILLAQMEKFAGNGLLSVQNYMQAASIYKQLNLEVSLARQYVNLANLFKDQLSQYQMALKHYLLAEQTFKKVGENEALWATQIDHVNALLDMGQIDLAMRKISNTMARLDPLINTESWHRNFLMLAKAHYRKGNSDLAEHIVDGLEASLQNDPELIRSHPRFLALFIDTQNLKALLKAEKGFIPDAIALFRSTIKECEEQDLKGKLAVLYNNLGYWLREQGDTQGAKDEHQKALKLDMAQGLRISSGVAFDLRNLGFAWLKEGDLAEADPYLHEALYISQKLGMPFNAAQSALGLGDSAFSESRFPEAHAFYKTALELSLATHSPQLQWIALAGLGHSAFAQGYISESYDFYQRSLRIARELLKDINSSESRLIFQKQERFQLLISGLEKTHHYEEPYSARPTPFEPL